MADRTNLDLHSVQVGQYTSNTVGRQGNLAMLVKSRGQESLMCEDSIT